MKFFLKDVFQSSFWLLTFISFILLSCDSDESTENAKEKLIPFTIQANYAGKNPIKWDSKSELSVCSYAKSTKYSLFAASGNPDDNCMLTFTGNLSLSDGDIIYAVYPKLQEEVLPSQIPFDLSEQNENSSSIFTSSILYTEDMGETIPLNFKEQLATLNFRLSLSADLDIATLAHVSIMSTDLYTVRYLDLTKGEPFWSGGKKTALMKIKVLPVTIPNEENLNEVFFDFKALVFPVDINSLSIRLENADNMILYTRTLSEVDLNLNAGENLDYPTIEYVPGNPNNQGGFDDVMNNGDLFE